MSHIFFHLCYSLILGQYCTYYISEESSQHPNKYSYIEFVEKKGKLEDTKGLIKSRNWKKRTDNCRVS